MKLLKQTQRMFFRVVLPVFTIAGILMYFALQWAFTHETDEKLAGMKSEIEIYLKMHDTIPVFFQSIETRFEIIPVKTQRVGSVYADTMMLNPFENEEEPYRQLIFPVVVNGQSYRASIAQSTIESEDLVMMVASLVVVLFGLLIMVMFWVNRAVAQKVWQPFYEILEKARGFRPSDVSPISLTGTNIDEFRELNTTLEALSTQIQKDFQTVKQFTENASHELQTPLAVIQNKVELLIQDKSLSEFQASNLDIIAQSTRRMARLNHSLLLLSKIENFQFFERQPVNLKAVLEKKLKWLEDFIREKQLISEVQLTDNTIHINSFLAETLISNLLTNAVKHNLPSGILQVQLTTDVLIIKNAALQPHVPVPDLITRFVRGNHQNDGAGLGLAMVAEICEQEKFELDISFENDIWTTEIRLKNEPLMDIV